MNEEIRAKGVLTVRVYENGVLVDTKQGNNLVVLGGRNALAALIGGDGGTDKVINQFAWGEGTDAPVAGDAALTNETVKAIDNVTYPAPGIAQIEFSIGTSEGNGLAISEFGLYTDDNTLFARKVFGAINKTSSIRIEANWQIIF